MDEPKKTGEGSVNNIKVTNLDVDTETSSAPVEQVVDIEIVEDVTPLTDETSELQSSSEETEQLQETAKPAQEETEPVVTQPAESVTEQAEPAQDTELQTNIEPVVPVAPTIDEPAATDISGIQVSPEHNNSSKKSLIAIIILIVGLVLIALGGALALSIVNKEEPTSTQNTQQVKVVLMGAELSVVDGLVQTSNDNMLWLDVKLGDQVAEGSYIRAQQNGRAVIALDDGSAIRINSNSAVKLDSLDATNVVITNEAGEVYTRLVKSDRKFSVNVADESYVAMGTAYITVNTDDAKGVEVYESKVKLAKSNIEVPEGKYYYNEAKNAEQLKKLTDLNVDELKKDAFIAWNYQQDKAKAEFKDKLGYLTKIDEQVAVKTVAGATAAKPAEQPVNGIKLTGVKYDTGVKLSWSLTNVTAPKGFKVVKSLTANPTFGKDEATYVSDPNAKSYAWTIKDGKTYHFRVCIYSASGCTEYSNDITVTAPKVAEAPKPAPTGTLSLTSAGGNDFNWVLKGSAPYGYKLVWSTSANPVYPNPDNNYEFYETESTKMGSISPKTTGTYYVRVCMYNNGSCLNYSENVKVTL